ncbi:MAG: GTPase ObgE [Acidobacteria bacterium]|nr:GTPase ObgE [Acidobacteriota bacterium]
MSGFVDSAQLHAKGGDGGAGCVSFRREAHVAKGGPDGGDGGKGGDVWLVADHNQASLLGFRDHPFRRATDGEHGTSKRQHGSRGRDLEVPVPVGTVVTTLDGDVLVDLAHAGDRWRAAEGGLGGFGNNRFLSNRRRAPAFAEQGEHGEERWFNLELKLRADVALIGFPNVGKSTLISQISKARPKIADYPFTTLVPNLGVVRYSNRPGRDDAGTEFVVADIPGLIEGAAEGRGLGHSFLKHVEYARVLCVLLDMAPTATQTPEEQLEILLRELGDYQPALVERPRIVIGSRADMAAEVALPDGVTPVSSFTREGLNELVATMAQYVDTARREEVIHHSREIVVHRPVVDTVRVERRPNGEWQVLGRAALRAVRFQDLTNDEALEEVTRRLKEIGVDRLLTRAGALDGDVVTIGQLTFEWYRDATTAGLDRAGHHRATRRERLARQGRLEEFDDE